MTYFKLLAVCSFLLLSLQAHAQHKDFGQISIEDFENYNHTYDSASAAITLFDVADIWFDGDHKVIMDRHTRLKILNNSGYDYGDINIYYDKNQQQSVSEIKAATYTTHNSRVFKTEITNQEIFEERLYDRVYSKKFSMPQLENGAIVEYSYRKILGNPFALPDWKFHKEIPVNYSEINMKIPWRFNYLIVFKGVDTLFTNKYENYIDDRGGGYIINVSKKDLPPVEDIPFVNSRDDFISEMYTQLNYVHRDNGLKVHFLKDWKKVSSEIRSHPNIGKQKLNRAMRAKVKELVKEASDPENKMKVIYDFVAGSISWNGLNQVYSEKGIRDTYKQKHGSSGDINILLYKMLREASLTVSYGLTSTRSNGTILPNFPLINQFNHILAVIEIDGRAYILDASEGNRSIHLPPVKNLYQLVLVIQDKSFGWIETKPALKTAEKQILEYRIDESGKVKATLTSSSTGYAAQEYRNMLNELGKKESAKTLLDGLSSPVIDSVVVRGVETDSRTLTHIVDFTFDLFDGDSLEVVNYFNPLLFLSSEVNPFTQPSRDFPIYFPFPLQHSIHTTIHLPDNYYVEELPDQTVYSLPGNTGFFNFFTNSTDSSVSIISDYALHKMAFESEEYEYIKEMHARMAAKHSSAIVIKKKL